MVLQNLKIFVILDLICIILDQLYILYTYVNVYIEIITILKTPLYIDSSYKFKTHHHGPWTLYP